MANVFDTTGVKPPGRSKFNLSYQKKFDFDMGQLIPIMCDEAVPGDVWKIQHQAVIRWQPLIKPILHQVKMKTYYFFVPYRLLDENWETIISKGVTGNSGGQVPLWPIDPSLTPPANERLPVKPSEVRYSLWDYLGFPLADEDNTAGYVQQTQLPIDYPRRAYYFVWNEFFRDENLQPEFPWNDDTLLWDTAIIDYWRNDYNPTTVPTITQYRAGMILFRNWYKDYLTSALPFQQRGTAPSVPISMNTNLFSDDFGLKSSTLGNNFTMQTTDDNNVNTDINHYGLLGGASVNRMSYALRNALNLASYNPGPGNGFTLDIKDIRNAMQVQVWREKNARAGVRYTEFIRAHFPAYPRDERLQRPEFIGGSTSPIIISEVLQNSMTDADPTTESGAQGNLAGHGLGVSSQFIGKYRVEEFGLIIGLMTVCPKADYQDGMPKQWRRRTTFDFYFPEFAHLSEREVLKSEVSLFMGDIEKNNETFGFQGMYNEMRYKNNQVCGALRDTEAYWHLGRKFPNDSTDDIELNSSFIVCDPSKHVFAVQDVPGMICSFGNQLDVLRPMPYEANPAGLVRS